MDFSDIPINVYVSNDGRIHVDIGADIVIHYKGQKVEVIEDESVEYIRSSKAVITEGTLQLNPGGEFLREILLGTLKSHPVMEDINIKLLEESKAPVESPIEKKTKLIRKQYIHRKRYQKGRKGGRTS